MSLNKFDDAVIKKCARVSRGTGTVSSRWKRYAAASAPVSSLSRERQIRAIAYVLSPSIPINERIRIVQTMPIPQMNALAAQIPANPTQVSIRAPGIPGRNLIVRDDRNLIVPEPGRNLIVPEPLRAPVFVPEPEPNRNLIVPRRARHPPPPSQTIEVSNWWTGSVPPPASRSVFSADSLDGDESVFSDDSLSLTDEQWGELTRENLEEHLRGFAFIDPPEQRDWWDVASSAQNDGVPMSVRAEEAYIGDRPRLQGIERQALREGGDPSEFRRLRTALWTEGQNPGTWLWEQYLGLPDPLYPREVRAPPEPVDIGRVIHDPWTPEEGDVAVQVQSGVDERTEDF